MKKWFAGILFAVLLSITSVYIFIPSKIAVSNVRFVLAYQNGVLRFFNDSAKFNNWWKSVAATNGNGYNYKGYDYHITRVLSNVVEIRISSPAINTLSTFISLSYYLDSSVIQWGTEINAPLNPIERIKRYNEAKEMKRSMSGLMDMLKTYLDNSANLYGIVVKEIHLKDSLLISTKIKTDKYPSISEIYGQVEKLKEYAASNHASPTDYPMLNVTKIDDKNYQVMVGLPINLKIKETADISIKKMPYLKSMFVSTIKGGSYSISDGFKKLNKYLMDSKRATPAIPFELLITDRPKEPDTSKWVTQLYMPVM